jgi:hypothetical protein
MWGQVSPHGAVCNVLGTIVEIFGEMKSSQATGDLQRQALVDVFTIAMSYMKVKSTA